jgi:hypothetical protein
MLLVYLFTSTSMNCNHLVPIVHIQRDPKWIYNAGGLVTFEVPVVRLDLQQRRIGMDWTLQTARVRINHRPYSHHML